MSAFSCKACGYDLTIRVDLLAVTIQEEFPDGDYPDDLAIEGNCNECNSTFSFSGRMFTQFVKIKAEEGVICEEVQDYDIVNIPLTEEQFEEFNRLVEFGDQDLIQEFIHSIIKDLI